jgi:hypothetical protein
MVPNNILKFNYLSNQIMATYVTTVNGLRTFSGTPTANDVFETTDYGTGVWYYDSSDTTSDDNTGTVLKCGSYRFKRILTEPAVEITWFGAVGNGSADCYDAIHAAIDFVNGNGRVIIPTGIFYLNKPPLTSTSSIIGALKLPHAATGLVISGQGKSSVLKLSANVPRAFDIPLPPNISTVYTYQNIIFEKFDVDANLIDGDAMGPTLIVTGVGGIVGSFYEISVVSTAGMTGTGFLYFPYSNTGCARAINSYYQKKAGSSTILQLNLASGKTVSIGDTIKGYCNMHVLIGTYNNNYQYNINTDNITISDINLLNIPPAENPPYLYGQTQTARKGIHIASGSPGNSGFPGGYTGVITAANILIERVKVFGGCYGIAITNAGSVGLADYFIDNVVFRDCYHDTLNIGFSIAAGSANFHIANGGYGNMALIERCEGHNSGDVGIEVDSLADANVVDCNISNSVTAGYFVVNYNRISTSAVVNSTTTLSSGISNTDVTMTVAAFPNVQYNGFLTIDQELIYYAYTGSTTLSLVRGCNNTTPAAYSSGAIVSFIELSRQKIQFSGCNYLNNRAGNLSKGFDVVTEMSGLFPLPPVSFQNCSYTRLNSCYLGYGEALNVNGYPDIHIDGFDCNIKGIVPVGIKNSSAIYIYNHINHSVIDQLPACTLLMSNVNIIVDGVLDDNGDTRYWSIYLDSGNWHIHWDNIDIRNNLLTAYIGHTQSAGIVIGASDSTDLAKVSGVIDSYKFSASEGSASPVGIAFNTRSLFGRLLIDNPDFSDLIYTYATNNNNYKPWTIDASVSLAKSVIFSNVKHANFNVLNAASNVTNRLNISSNYTVDLTEEYLGVNTSTATIGITLPTVEAGPTSSKTNYGYQLIIVDETNNASTNNITITPFSGQKINNSASPVILNTNGAFITLIAIPGGWISISSSAVSSLTDNTANGVAVTWANRKTTPTPTVVLGAITPGSIASAGRISAGTSVTNPTTQALLLSSNGGQQIWEQTTGGTDEKLWDLINNGTSFLLRALNDANSAASNWLQVSRTGTNINYVSFPNSSVGIGSTSLSVSAKLQVVSTTQGAVCMPVMGTAQKLAISSPIEGLQVYDSSLHTPCYYNGSAWLSLTPPVVEITSTTQAALVNTKYIANNASLVTIILPTTAVIGQQIIVRGKGAGGWKVAQNSGQTIHGATNTTTGTSGYIASQAQYDTVTLECITNNSDFVIVSNTGTLTIL